VTREHGGGVQERKPAAVFIAYSREDKRLRDRLVKHLAILEREGLVRVWYDGRIIPGEKWEDEIRRHLQGADLILLLVSADFVASEYCYDVEMKIALDRHRKGEVVVLPIILRESDWSSLPIAELQALPEGAKPITRWSDRDAAFKSVSQGIRRVLVSIAGARDGHAGAGIERVDLLAQRPSVTRKGAE